MLEAQVPELADGGYWYSVEAVQDARGNWTPGQIPNGYCCDYGDIDGVKYAFIRRPDPTVMPPAPIAVDAVVTAAGYLVKPEFRVLGR